MSNELGHWVFTTSNYCFVNDEEEAKLSMLESAKRELFDLMADVIDPFKEYKTILTYGKREDKEFWKYDSKVYYDFWLRVIEIPTCRHPSLR